MLIKTLTTVLFLTVLASHAQNVVANRDIELGENYARNVIYFCLQRAK
jgi:hypothetical protein